MPESTAAAPAASTTEGAAAVTTTDPADSAAGTAAAPAAGAGGTTTTPAASDKPAADGGAPAPKPAAPAPDSPEGKAAAEAAALAEKTAAREAAIKAGVLEVAPEKYEPFKMPENVTVDQKSLEDFMPVAKELGLSQTSAQKIIDTYATKILPGLAAQHAEAIAAQDKSWVDTIKADKEIGGEKFAENMEFVKTTLNRFATPGLVKYLNDTRLGNHPELVRVFYKIGKSMTEDSVAGAGAGGAGEKDAASVLYPDMKTQ